MARPVGELEELVGALTDRLAVQDLLAAYCDAIDRRRWDALDDVFTEDAVLDYTEVGGPRGGPAEIKAFLADALAAFSSTMHLVGLPVVRLEGDVAHARTPCHNPMVLAGPGGADGPDGRDGQDGGPAQLLVVALWYRDELVRTPAGWRIRHRHAERGHLT